MQIKIKTAQSWYIWVPVMKMATTFHWTTYMLYEISLNDLYLAFTMKNGSQKYQKLLYVAYTE